jgi:hypothetical protein
MLTEVFAETGDVDELVTPESDGRVLRPARTDPTEPHGEAFGGVA